MRRKNHPLQEYVLKPTKVQANRTNYILSLGELEQHLLVRLIHL
ncbi:hypothetical protein EV13_0939 [Prochlorococcus sp. MIT 0702]|nr:hypothetical protein EV12_0440 [Prochlorococcus sp. MIT 0701]KGG29721.1 hypothetical protein EV13_0939 [Prochlorococcus sp. MIT 0702]KGG34276.1 hypothetical protein EV14_1370 [Prochlorococcus sp. MIT 0703]